MKKLFLIFTCIVLATVIQAKASDGALFQLDLSTVYEEFEGLTLLENYVANNEGVTLNELIANEDPLISDLNIPANSKGLLNTLGTAMDFDTASFLLGVGAGIAFCVLSCFISIYAFAYSVPQ